MQRIFRSAVLLPTLAVAALPALLTAQGTATPEITPLVEGPRTPVCNQGMTGTCWSFATVSFLESEVIRTTGKQVDLSEMFHVYHAYMDKTETYVRLHGKAQFSQGGLCHDVFASLAQHGVVPAHAYTGLKGESPRHNHRGLDTSLLDIAKKFSKANGKDALGWKNAAMEILDERLGTPPVSFEVDGKNLTPQQYARDVLGLKAEQYASVMSYSYAPFGQHAELLVPDNWMRYQGYLNVPVEEMIGALDHALRSGFSVAVDMDVSEPGFSAAKPLVTLPADLEDEAAITDALRQQTFDDRSTTDDHLMHAVGIAKDENGKEWYIVKNSWGTRAGLAGYHYFSRPYMALKLLSFSVHQDGLPKGIRAQFGM